MNNQQRVLLLQGRRRFLMNAIAGGVVSGMGGLPSLSRMAWADDFARVEQPILAQMMLNGGPDHRHLFMPRYTTGASSYGRLFWEARARSQNLTGTSASVVRARWNDGYFSRTDAGSGTQFGILKKAAWLKDMWDAGNVAIVSNVAGDDSRDHENAIRSMELGNINAVKLTRGSGWGGRASVAAGGKAVSLTKSMRTFALGPDPDAPANLSRASDANVVPAGDMRNLKPYVPAPDDWLGDGQHVARSLNAYYAAKRRRVSDSSPFARFFEHERKLREFGELVNTRLATVPMPADLAALGDYDTNIYEGPVDSDLAQQMRNLHDALACNDLLDMRVASLEYNGWDTHDRQRNEIEYRLEALYGRDQALDRLWRNLPGQAKSRLVLVICGEFGRQLRANGGNGTDHGYGNDVILIGQPVRGGIYGDKFPEDELARLDVESSDIDGLTAIDRLFGRVCDWLEPGSASTVFPNINASALEPGLGLGSLIA